MQRKTISHQFDCYCKKILRDEFRDCLREVRRLQQHEITFSEVFPQVLERLIVMDEYSAEITCFNVLGYAIEVKSDLISDALTSLPEQKRNIILLSYFLDMTDQVIGETLNMLRSTVKYQRSCTLKQLYKLLEGKADEGI